jgi:glucose-6-phosphate dehydrogenase assembly protein OpcA
MNSATASFLSGVPVRVNPTDIERELASLWKPASEENGASEAVVRACLANLVIFLPGPEERDYVARILPEVTRRHPNRIIHLVVDRGDRSAPRAAASGAGEDRGSRLEASVTAMCSAVAPGIAPVCCEQITLRARPGEEPLLAGSVAPLLVPDIPVFLWWTGDYRNPLLPRIAQFVDRVIVDSRNENKGGAILQDLRRLSSLPEVKEVVDLGWRGLGRWRQTIADLFDDPAVRPLIPELGRVEVERAPASGGAPCSLAQSALVTGWMASRLGWAFAGKEVSGAGAGEIRTILFRTPAGRPAQASLRVKREFPLGRIPAGEPVRVRLSTRGPAEEAYVKIAIDGASPKTAQVSFQTPYVCLLPGVLPMPHLSDGELLGEVLNTPVHPYVFREALEVAAPIAEP